jgi:hypothetical protein
VLLDEGVPSVVNFYPIDTERIGGRLNWGGTWFEFLLTK